MHTTDLLVPSNSFTPWQNAAVRPARRNKIPVTFMMDELPDANCSILFNYAEAAELNYKNRKKLW